MDKYICVFCGERKSGGAHITVGRIGICTDCYDSIPKSPPALPYRGDRNLSYIMSPFEYTGKMRSAILEFKFRSCSAYAPLFASMMQSYISSYGSLASEFDCIAPVPLHPSRMRERGYNQSELIARHVARANGVELRPDMLVRTRATKRQSELRGTQRAMNVKDAFACTGMAENKRILLFDDICTTGATLRFCADALAARGAKKICALTLAIHARDNLPEIMY